MNKTNSSPVPCLVLAAALLTTLALPTPNGFQKKPKPPKATVQGQPRRPDPDLLALRKP
jgi:hypothetical protein